ncbi:hypothetical protein D7193_22660 [Micromonospora costi]|uniref:Pycsar effector protein domain-containing protein n=1 Tax=Micromonospora costi TaxID=1530042 RepID=A0A3A9ZZY4_9ACTN|nr:hypothetical protein D7193_22660 [Micromonospora costi]
MDTALATVRLHQDSIQHADTKIARLAGLHGAMVALVVNAAPATRLSVNWTSAVDLATLCIAALFVLTVVVSAHHLSLGFRPRTFGPTPPNRFGFRARNRRGIASADYDRRSERSEAWTLVAVLAGIAFEKHQRVKATMPWTFAATLCTAAWLALAVLVK